MAPSLKFDPRKFLATIGAGRKILSVSKGGTIYSQGENCDAVFYVQKGRVKLTVVSANGKEATIGILNSGDFVGEGGLAGHLSAWDRQARWQIANSCASKRPQ